MQQTLPIGLHNYGFVVYISVVHERAHVWSKWNLTVKCPCWISGEWRNHSISSVETIMEMLKLLWRACQLMQSSKNEWDVNARIVYLLLTKWDILYVWMKMDSMYSTGVFNWSSTLTIRLNCILNQLEIWPGCIFISLIQKYYSL